MATIFTHALLPVALKAGIGRGVISSRLLWASVLATILPDVDVLAFLYGIPYGDAFGHRGFTHSISFAFTAGLLAAGYADGLNSTKTVAFLVVFASMVSHPLLDALTNGGLGVAFLWPFSDTRYFMPWQPIEVSPIGARGFFTERGVRVLASEFIWIVLPLMAGVLCLKIVSRIYVLRGKYNGR